MAKTTIKGKFATGADAATVHQISQARRQWLDREIDKAVADVVVLFAPLSTKAHPNGKKPAATPKRAGSKPTENTLRFRAKKK